MYLKFSSTKPNTIATLGEVYLGVKLHSSVQQPYVIVGCINVVTPTTTMICKTKRTGTNMDAIASQRLRCVETY
jgi:hypothetical protein